MGKKKSKPVQGVAEGISTEMLLLLLSLRTRSRTICGINVINYACALPMTVNVLLN